MIANTPSPPYYSVIFTSILDENHEGYDEMAGQMVKLASEQEGFLGIESSRSEIGITVSYWKDVESIKKWKSHSDHLFAQEKGKSTWYEQYMVRICKVERAYSNEI